MEVNAINGVSKINFEGRSSKKDKKAGSMGYDQVQAPASKESSNAMKTLLYSALLAGAAGTAMTTTSCSKGDWLDKGSFAFSTSESNSDADANVCFRPVDPKVIYVEVPVIKRDTVLQHDTIEKHVVDSVPYPVFVTDTLKEIIHHYDTVHHHDTTIVDHHHYHTDTVTQIKERIDTLWKYITEHDTLIIKELVPTPVKQAPWHLADSLIAQGLNIGVELDGPKPKETNNNVLFVGSIAYNEYDYKLYETQLDSIGTNAEQLSLITKVTAFYDDDDPSVSVDNPKVSYMKTTVVDVPGKGIKLDRFVMDPKNVRRYGFDENNAPKSSHFGWEYAGYEIRRNDRNGQTNSIFDKHGIQIGESKGEYKRGLNMGEFLYGTYVYDENGNPYVDPNTGEYEKAYYDFSRAKMWSREFQKVEIPAGTSATWA